MSFNAMEWFRASAEAIPPEQRVEMAWHDLGPIDWAPIDGAPVVSLSLASPAVEEGYLKTLLEQELTQAVEGWLR